MFVILLEYLISSADFNSGGVHYCKQNLTVTDSPSLLDSRRRDSVVIAHYMLSKIKTPRAMLSGGQELTNVVEGDRPLDGQMISNEYQQIGLQPLRTGRTSRGGLCPTDGCTYDDDDKSKTQMLSNHNFF